MARRDRDRRLAPRYRIDAAIRVDGQTALAIDLSLAGVFFEATRPFDVGDRVELLLPYEHVGASVASTAQVVRVEPRGRFYGVAATYEPVAFTIPA